MRAPPPPEVRRAAMQVVALLVRHGFCDEQSGRLALEYFAAGDHLMANHTIAAAKGNRQYEARMKLKKGMQKSRSTSVHAWTRENGALLPMPLCGSRSEKVSLNIHEVSCKHCVALLVKAAKEGRTP